MQTDQIMIHKTYRHYANRAIKSRLKRIETIKMKKCASCFQEKQFTEFNTNNNVAGGLQPYCKPCHSAYYKAYNAAMKQAQPRTVPQSKVCRDCGLEKPISQFGKRSVSPDKHNIYCKPCWRQLSYGYQRKARNGG